MSDSQKLHFIYGILFLIIALILFSAIVTIVVLSIVKIIEATYVSASFILLIIFVLFISLSIDEFKEVGQLSKK